MNHVSENWSSYLDIYKHHSKQISYFSPAKAAFMKNLKFPRINKINLKIQIQWLCQPGA
jgi:hypothetical protein